MTKIGKNDRLNIKIGKHFTTWNITIHFTTWNITMGAKFILKIMLF